MGSLARVLHPARVIPSTARRAVNEVPQEGDLENGRMRIHPFDIMTIGDETIAQMRAEEAGAAGHQNCLSIHHVTTPIRGVE